MAEDETLREALLELQFLRDREARTLDETKSLLDCLEAFTGATNAGDALASIFVSLRQKVGAALSLVIARKDGGDLCVVASDDPRLLGTPIAPPFDPFTRARNISDLQVLGTWEDDFDTSRFKGMISTPAADGLALVTFREPPSYFRKDDLNLVQRISGLAAQALRNSEIAAEKDLLAATVAGSSSGFAISDATDPRQPLIYVNEAFERLSGFSVAEALGENCRFLSAEEPNAPERERLRQAVKSLEGGQFLLKNRRKSGELFWNELTLSPVYGEEGIVKNLVATQTDVTERVETEEREEKLTRELFRLQRQEAIAQLTAGVAHDFNNLLSAINGSATLIGMSKDLPDDVLEHLDRISRAGAQSAKLVARLLDIGAHDESEGAFELVSVLSDLPALVEGSLPSFITFTIKNDAEPRALTGNPGTLSQILINLVLNARDALDRGSGNIALKTETIACVADETLQVGALTAGRSYVKLTVCDDGSGMTMETAASVFNPYFTTKGRLGTGLGLATAALQVRTLGGGIDIESSVGEGTHVSIYWPLANVEVQTPVQGADGGENLSGRTIIIVDDDPNVSAVVGTYLESLGAEVAACEDPRDAIEAVTDDPTGWSALITDYDMPIMTGGELVAKLRAETPDIPVFVVTALAKRLSDPRLANEQVKGIFGKPIDLVQLSQALAAHANSE